MVVQYEQMSLFRPCEEAEAICCMDGGRTTASAPDGWMTCLVPNGEYVVMVGAHPLVLRLVDLRAEEIPEGNRYYHYTIGGRVYAGIFA